MTDMVSNTSVGALGRSWVRACGRAWAQAIASLSLQWRAFWARFVGPRAPARRHPHHAPYAERQAWHALIKPRSRLLRRSLIGLAVFLAFIGSACGIVWWQVSTGPVSVDMITPWLTSAIEERLGGRHRVEVGGTVLERDETGRTALRLRDVVVYDAAGTEVARAPKAEVGLSGVGLLTGSLRAERLSLIGAEMAVRIEADGQVTIFAGGNKRPIATAQAPQHPAAAPAPAPETTQAVAPAPPSPKEALAGFLAWAEGVDALGLAGASLSEIGLKSGTLTVDDRRGDKHWSFQNINLSLTRPRGGGVAFAINSTGTDGPWSLTATVTPGSDGRRIVEAVVRDVSPKDLMLALRLGSGQMTADLPLSAALRAEVTADGALQSLEGRVVAGAGFIGEPGDTSARLLIDEAQISVRWVPGNNQVLVPIEIMSGPNRVTLFGQVDVPAEQNGVWGLSIVRGAMSLASGTNLRDPPLIIDRVNVMARLDPARKLVEIERGEIAAMVAGISFRGTIDYAAEPHISLGVAGTRMPVSAFTRMWPVFGAGNVRSWVVERVGAATIEQVEIALNMPLAAFTQGGPAITDEALSIKIRSSGTVLRPLDNMPALRDADLETIVIGRKATVKVGRAIADLPSGRKLTLTNGLFEVPDTQLPVPTGWVWFRVDGNADAGAELVAMERLRDTAGLTLDPATTRGTFNAQVGLNFPMVGEVNAHTLNYAIKGSILNFTADKLVRGHKLEAQALNVEADPQGFEAKGDVKIAGVPGKLVYARKRADGDATVSLSTTLDDITRNRFNLAAANTVTGPMKLDVKGTISAGERESRFTIKADLKDTAIAELLPGWWKTAGKPASATFTIVDRGQTTKLENIVVDGAGMQIKGAVELGGSGEVIVASFPVFNLSDADKANNLHAERALDGTLRVTLRGEVLDGRAFLKSALAGPGGKAKQQAQTDLNLDINVKTIIGHNGEALKNAELSMTRRAGQIRTFSLSGRIGLNAPLKGDMRAYANGRQVLYLETLDAGAFFRFTDTYPRMHGGQMWVALDPPTANEAPQAGVLNVRDFVIRGEPQLERVVAGGPVDGRSPQPAGSGVQFARMRVEFTRTPGKMAIRDAVVFGPMIGATIEGQIDYAQEKVDLTGTFVPAYALNNIPASVPLLGLFFGGPNEGVFGVTFAVVGRPSAPVLRVNPLSPLMPGILRKLFQFRSVDPSAPPPALLRDR